MKCNGCDRKWRTKLYLSTFKHQLKHFYFSHYYMKTGQSVYLCDLLILWDHADNYYSVNRWQGSTFNPKHSLYGTSRLELSVSSYKKFHYHLHFQGTSENWTVCCSIQRGLNISSATSASDLNSWHMAPRCFLTFDVWHFTSTLSTFKVILQLRHIWITYVLTIRWWLW